MGKSKRLRNKRRYSGQFNCDGCGNTWTSEDLIIQECQHCYRCGKKVSPIFVTLTTSVDTNNIEVNVNEKYFGQFQCYKCLRTWFSAHSWLSYQQQCRQCSTWTTPHKLRPKRRPQGMDSKNDLKKPHESDKCAKCRQIGHNCRNVKIITKMLRNLIL